MGSVSSRLPRECTEAGVIFRQFDSEKKILECGQKAVGDVFVQRHPASQRSAAKNARGKHHVVDTAGDHACHRRNQGWCVLVVRVNHDDDIGARSKGFAIAGLLVAAVSVI